ncbi:MAG: GAF domain-containing protein [Proteobacteria bacterium]|nr:GAF domain-containing protein [Pseudomonadota bacterium]
MEVADLWHLPTLIITSMKTIPLQEIKNRNAKIDRHRKLANFANELCGITINSSPEQRQEQLRSVLKKYKSSYSIPDEEIVQMMDSALSKMRDFADVLNLKQTDLCKLDLHSFKLQSDLPTVNVLDDSVNTLGEQASAVDSAEAPERFTVRAGAPPAPSITRNEDKPLVILDAIQEITNAMLDDFTFDPVLTMILETVYRGIGFDQVIIFFRNSKTNIMQPRFVLGQNVEELQMKFNFPVEESSGDLFNQALAEGRDLYIENIDAFDVNHRKPTWFRGVIFAPSVVLYPIIINRKAVGLIYGSYLSLGHHLNKQQLESLKTLRNQAALAIKLSSVGIL